MNRDASTKEQQLYGHNQTTIVYHFYYHYHYNSSHTATMNFSEPGCASTLTTTATHSLTPLTFAHTLQTDIPYPTTLTALTSHLHAIHLAAYLYLLPKTCPTCIAYHRTETARITNSALGPAVFQASGLFFLNTFRADAVDMDLETARAQNEDIFEATGKMLVELEEERERYLGNMTVLFREVEGRWREEVEMGVGS